MKIHPEIKIREFPTTPMIELTEKEQRVIELLRSYEPYVNFHIEKRPSKEDKSKGELTRITIEESILL